MELPNIKWIISVMFLSTTNMMCSPDGFSESRRDDKRRKTPHPVNHELRSMVWLRQMPPFFCRATRN